MPVTNPYAADFLAKQNIRRRVQIRVSDFISTPLTYGMLNPVILMPKNIDWENKEQLNYVLSHEIIHIKRFDGILKLILVATLCLHWFNPLVWLMYILANRDIELNCDDTLIRTLGEKEKKAYALTLINMKERQITLPPLYNNFSKNAVKERITSIMKTRKKSIIIVIVAVVLVVVIALPFATSAMPKDNTESAFIPKTEVENTDVKNSAFAQATTKNKGTDYNKSSSFNPLYDEATLKLIKMLKFDGYEDMTVAQFHDTVKNSLTNTNDINLFYGIFDTENFGTINDLKDTNPDANFVFYTLIPFTGKYGVPMDYSGYTESDFNVSENAIIEYTYSLDILDTSKITVKEYTMAREGIANSIENILKTKSIDELLNEDAMKEEIQGVIDSLHKKWSNDALKTEISYNYKPVTALDKEAISEITAVWEDSLTPYFPFGVTYEINEYSGQAKLYLHGKEIRGIFNSITGEWISNSIGDSTFSEAVPEIVTVYIDNKLTGLREATKEEQENWNSIRRAGVSEEEEFIYTNKNKDDYTSILKLKTQNYKAMSVYDFNQALLNWANEDYERSEHINWDIGTNSYSMPLTAEEKEFLDVTINASANENAMLVQSIRMDIPRQDAEIAGDFTKEPENDTNGNRAFCNLFYTATYHIPDEKKITVKQRDDAVLGVKNAIQSFWDSTDINTLLAMNKNDMLKKLNEIAKNYSNNLISIEMSADNYVFEHIDERVFEKVSG